MLVNCRDEYMSYVVFKISLNNNLRQCGSTRDQTCTRYKNKNTATQLYKQGHPAISPESISIITLFYYSLYLIVKVQQFQGVHVQNALYAENFLLTELRLLPFLSNLLYYSLSILWPRSSHFSILEERKFISCEYNEFVKKWPEIVLKWPTHNVVWFISNRSLSTYLHCNDPQTFVDSSIV